MPTLADLEKNERYRSASPDEQLAARKLWYKLEVEPQVQSLRLGDRRKIEESLVLATPSVLPWAESYTTLPHKNLYGLGNAIEEDSVSNEQRHMSNLYRLLKKYSDPKLELKPDPTSLNSDWSEASVAIETLSRVVHEPASLLGVLSKELYKASGGGKEDHVEQAKTLLQEAERVFGTRGFNDVLRSSEIATKGDISALVVENILAAVGTGGTGNAIVGAGGQLAIKAGIASKALTGVARAVQSAGPVAKMLGSRVLPQAVSAVLGGAGVAGLDVTRQLIATGAVDTDRLAREFVEGSAIDFVLGTGLEILSPLVRGTVKALKPGAVVEPARAAARRAASEGNALEALGRELRAAGQIGPAQIEVLDGAAKANAKAAYTSQVANKVRAIMSGDPVQEAIAQMGYQVKRSGKSWELRALGDDGAWSKLLATSDDQAELFRIAETARKKDFLTQSGFLTEPLYGKVDITGVGEPSSLDIAKVVYPRSGEVSADAVSAGFRALGLEPPPVKVVDSWMPTKSWKEGIELPSKITDAPTENLIAARVKAKLEEVALGHGDPVIRESILAKIEKTHNMRPYAGISKSGVEYMASRLGLKSSDRGARVVIDGIETGWTEASNGLLSRLVREDLLDERLTLDLISGQQGISFSRVARKDISGMAEEVIEARRPGAAKVLGTYADIDEMLQVNPQYMPKIPVEMSPEGFYFGPDTTKLQVSATLATGTPEQLQRFMGDFKPEPLGVPVVAADGGSITLKAPDVFTVSLDGRLETFASLEDASRFISEAKDSWVELQYSLARRGYEPSFIGGRLAWVGPDGKEISFRNTDEVKAWMSGNPELDMVRDMTGIPAQTADLFAARVREGLGLHEPWHPGYKKALQELDKAGGFVKPGPTPGTFVDSRMPGEVFTPVEWWMASKKDGWKLFNEYLDGAEKPFAREASGELLDPASYEKALAEGRLRRAGEQVVSAQDFGLRAYQDKYARKGVSSMITPMQSFLGDLATRLRDKTVVRKIRNVIDANDLSVAAFTRSKRSLEFINMRGAGLERPRALTQSERLLAGEFIGVAEGNVDTWLAARKLTREELPWLREFQAKWKTTTDYYLREFGVDLHTAHTRYIPEIRLKAAQLGASSEVAGTARDLAIMTFGRNALPAEVDFFAQNLRANTMLHMIKNQDPLALLDFYLWQGTRVKYMSGVMQEAKQAVDALADGMASGAVSPAYRAYAQRTQQFLMDVCGVGQGPYDMAYRAASVNLSHRIDAMIQKFAESPFGKKFYPNGRVAGASVTNDVIGQWINNPMTSSTQAFRALHGMRQLAQVTNLGGIFHGGLEWKALGSVLDDAAYQKEIINAGLLGDSLEPFRASYTRFIDLAKDYGMNPVRNGDLMTRIAAARLSDWTLDQGIDALARGKFKPTAHRSTAEQFFRSTGFDFFDSDTQTQAWTLLSRGEVDAARHVLRKATIDQAMFTVNASNAGLLFHGVLGKVFGKFGAYTAGYVNMMRRMVQQGSGLERLLRIGRLAANSVIMYEAFKQFGYDYEGFLFSDPLSWSGSPTYELLTDLMSMKDWGVDTASGAISGYGAGASQREGQSAWKSLQNSAALFIPGSSAGKGLARGIELISQGSVWDGMMQLGGAPKPRQTK